MAVNCRTPPLYSATQAALQKILLYLQLTNLLVQLRDETFHRLFLLFLVIAEDMASTFR